MSVQSTASLVAHKIAEPGLHKFLAGPKPDGWAKHAHFPCRVCGLGKGTRIPAGDKPAPVPEVVAVSDDRSVCVKCPTCNGKGTVALDIDDVQRLALKARAK